MKKALQLIAGVIIAALGVVVFTRQVELASVGRIIAQTDLWKIVVVALLNVGTLYFRSLRWGVLLPKRSGVVTTGYFPLVAIGFMVNNFMPFRIGEAVRALLLWKRNGYTVPESIGSLVIERLLDVLVFSTFLLVPVFLMPVLSEYRVYAELLSAGVLCVVGFFMLYALWPKMVAGAGRLLLQAVPYGLRKRTGLIAQELFSNFEWLLSVKKALVVVLLSYVTLACQIGMLSTLGSGVEHFTVFTSMFGVAFAAIGAAIPLAPGYVGTLHAMVLKGLGMAGIAADTAGALTILYHAIGYVTISALGLFFFVRLKISFADIRQAKDLSGSKHT